MVTEGDLISTIGAESLGGEVSILTLHSTKFLENVEAWDFCPQTYSEKGMRTQRLSFPVRRI